MLGTRGRAEAVRTAHGRRRTAEAAGRARRRTAARTSHVRRDVGRATLAVAATATVLLARLGSVLGLLQAEVVHVELVGHDCAVFAASLRGNRECKSFGVCSLWMCKGTGVVLCKERKRDTEGFMRGDVVLWSVMGKAEDERVR